MSELVTWKKQDGTAAQGILYKPENFDDRKKYPIIFNYYEDQAERVHNYPGVTFFNTPSIDCPTWFVSRGYLVFVPDISYKIGRTGESVLNSVIPAAEYLSTFSWVDSLKMAVCGSSFGGYETNYIITHTNKFAAAASGAGISNFISHYNGLQPIQHRELSGQGMYEGSQMRMGKTLWQIPQLYIENSPIFYINKVTTPILIMGNKGDWVVPWMQSVELFTGLRRLQKKAWMLQYDNGGHGVWNGPKEKDGKDLTMRLTQFFDHYLKGTPPPAWMTQVVLPN